MDSTRKYDLPISFTQSQYPQYRPTTERTVVIPHEYQEQEFQVIRPGPFQDTFDPTPRSRSADRTYGIGAYGSDPYYKAYENSDWSKPSIPLERTGNFNYFPSGADKETPKKIKEPISEQQEFRDLIRAETRNMDKDFRKDRRDPGLKVETQKKPFVPAGSGNRLGSGSKFDGKGSKTPRREDRSTPTSKKTFGEQREQREVEKKAGNKNVVPSFEKVDVQYSGQEEGNVVRYSNNEREESDVKQLEILIRDNKVKDRKIESLERQLEDLLAHVDVYKTKLTGHLEIIKKELMENDLHVLKLRENLYMLSAHNSRIVELSQRSKALDSSVSSFELGQEIEKNRTIWARMHTEIEKVTDHIKTSEEHVRKLWGIVIQQSETLTMDATTISGQILNYDLGKSKYESSYDVEKLKEEVRLYVDSLEAKEKTVKRLTGQVRDLEDLIANYLRTESGQLNNGLKNTARKLIELQTRLERSNFEKENLENQVVILKKKNESLQKEVTQLEREREDGKGLEKLLREAKTELKKAESKNEVLNELNGKNETIIATLKSMVSELKTNRQGFWDKGYTGSLYTEPIKYDPTIYTASEKYYDTTSYKVDVNPVHLSEHQTSTVPHMETWNYKDHNVHSNIDPLVSHTYDPHNREPMSQFNNNYENPLLSQQDYSRNLLGTEQKTKYDDFSKLEQSPAYLDRTVESWPVSAQFSPQSHNLGLSDSKANKDLFNIELIGMQGTNPYHKANQF